MRLCLGSFSIARPLYPVCARTNSLHREFLLGICGRARRQERQGACGREEAMHMRDGGADCSRLCLNRAVVKKLIEAKSEQIVIEPAVCFERVFLDKSGEYGRGGDQPNAGM